jgi:peptidyl-prolyl cis-trans isomerase SurA
MARIEPNATEAQKSAAKAKMDDAFKKLQDGQAWDKITETFSDDKQSSKNHGFLPPFGTGQMDPNVEEAAFSLTKLKHLRGTGTKQLRMAYYQTG